MINWFYHTINFFINQLYYNYVRSWINICFLLSETGLAPTAIFINSTTNMFSVYWNNPITHYDLVSGYEVTWRVSGSSSISSGSLGRNVNQYTVSGNLISGQLYTVTVICHVTLTNPAESTVVVSPENTVRTGMKNDK